MLAAAVFAIDTLPAGAHTRDENRAACQSTDPDTSIAACTEDIASGEETDSAGLAIAYYDRGLAYNARHDYTQSIADFSKAIELNPNDAKYYDERGVAYQYSNRNDEAIADYRAAMNINPDDDMALNNLTVLGAEP
jgi:Flp pilus assembly protein TadD